MTAPDPWLLRTAWAVMDSSRRRSASTERARAVKPGSSSAGSASIAPVTALIATFTAPALAQTSQPAFDLTPTLEALPKDSPEQATARIAALPPEALLPVYLSLEKSDLPDNARHAWGFEGSQILTVLSAPAEASRRPSGLYATE